MNTKTPHFLRNVIGFNGSKCEYQKTPLFPNANGVMIHATHTLRGTNEYAIISFLCFHCYLMKCSFAKGGGRMDIPVYDPVAKLPATYIHHKQHTSTSTIKPPNQKRQLQKILGSLKTAGGHLETTAYGKLRFSQQKIHGFELLHCNKVFGTLDLLTCEKGRDLPLLV